MKDASMHKFQTFPIKSAEITWQSYAIKHEISIYTESTFLPDGLPESLLVLRWAQSAVLEAVPCWFVFHSLALSRFVLKYKVAINKII